MEYTNGKNVISKLLKLVLYIGAFIILAVLVSKALFPVVIFGVLVWYSFKIVKSIKNHIYKLSTRNNVKKNKPSNVKDAADSLDINYEDSVIVDVEYEKVNNTKINEVK